jgi:predicted outer membrane repeat protein
VLSGGVFYFTINLFPKNFIFTNASFSNNTCGSRGGSIVGKLFNTSSSEISIKLSSFFNNTAYT